MRVLSGSLSSPSSFIDAPTCFGCSSDPPDSSSRSTVELFSMPTSATHSAFVKAPFWKSDVFSLIDSGNAGPTAARTAARLSSKNRDRFANDPPHRSVRLLECELRNWEIR